MPGGADVAETTYIPFADKKDAKPVRLIVRRVRPTPGSQLALFALYDYHAFITDREGETLELEADHRRHAEIENAIRDLKYGLGLNHLPSGRFAANAAWLAVQVIAHNLARWTARIGLGEGIVTTKTLRRRLFSLPGRLTRSARRVTLHLPARWSWAIGFTAALERLRRSRSSPDHLSQLVRRSGARGSLRRNRLRFIGGVGSELTGPPSTPHRFYWDLHGSSLARRALRMGSPEPSAAAHRWIRGKEGASAQAVRREPVAVALGDALDQAMAHEPAEVVGHAGARVLLQR